MPMCLVTNDLYVLMRGGKSAIKFLRSDFEIFILFETTRGLPDDSESLGKNLQENFFKLLVAINFDAINFREDALLLVDVELGVFGNPAMEGSQYWLPSMAGLLFRYSFTIFFCASTSL